MFPIQWSATGTMSIDWATRDFVRIFVLVWVQKGWRCLCAGSRWTITVYESFFLPSPHPLPSRRHSGPKQTLSSFPFSTERGRDLRKNSRSVQNGVIGCREGAEKFRIIAMFFTLSGLEGLKLQFVDGWNRLERKSSFTPDADGSNWASTANLMTENFVDSSHSLFLSVSPLFGFVHWTREFYSSDGNNFGKYRFAESWSTSTSPTSALRENKAGKQKSFRAKIEHFLEK